jgi:hypothetical protein
MFKRLHPPLALAAIVLVTTALGACGSSSPKSASKSSPSAIPSNSVALVGEIPITRANLNHWMHSMVGGDFWERFIKRAPADLVSEPANYAQCEVAARTLIAEGKHKRHFTPTQITQKCRQLYGAIREQAMTFLINVSWRINEGKENGIAVSDAEASSYAAHYVAQFYPKAGQYATYLGQREWAPSDDLYQVKRNLLTKKLREKVSGLSSTEEETPQARTKYFSFVKAHIAKRMAETRCRTEYSVSMCGGYREPASVPPAPVTILEEFLGQ